jgi:two-component system chemotaxis response regulator CheB
MNTDGDIEKALSTITGDILAKVKCRPKPVHDVQASTPAPKLSPQRNVIHRLDAIVIGSSTGGPNALQELIPSISAFCDVPIFIVQHMQKNFTASLAESLNANCQGLVKEAKHNEEAQPHHIYIAPGDQHLTLKRINHKIIIQLNQDAPECFCRPSVDVMFRSAASAWGHHCLAIVLTGMGSDGTKGLAHLKEKGVHVLVQDEASSVVWGMPGSAVKAGWADEILPLENIPPRVQQLLNFSRQ